MGTGAHAYADFVPAARDAGSVRDLRRQRGRSSARTEVHRFTVGQRRDWASRSDDPRTWRRCAATGTVHLGGKRRCSESVRSHGRDARGRVLLPDPRASEGALLSRRRGSHGRRDPSSRSNGRPRALRLAGARGHGRAGGRFLRTGRRSGPRRRADYGGSPIVRTAVDARLSAEARRFSFRFACEDCAHFDEPLARCSLSYPAAPRRERARQGAPRDMQGVRARH